MPKGVANKFAPCGGDPYIFLHGFVKFTWVTPALAGVGGDTPGQLRPWSMVQNLQPSNGLLSGPLCPREKHQNMICVFICGEN